MASVSGGSSESIDNPDTPDETASSDLDLDLL